MTRLAVRVRFVETDLMGIVHHAAYLSYVEAARVEYLRRRGANYRALVASGYHMPVVEAHLTYRKSSTFDDALVVSLKLGELTRVTVRFDFAISRLESGDEMLLVEGHTRLACIDANHKPRRIPEELTRAITLPESD